MVLNEPDFELRMKQLAEDAQSTFWGYLGCQLVQIDEQETVIELDIQKHHLNLLGILHGGVYASLLDNVMGLAAMIARPLDKVVTTNLNIHYVASLNQGKAIAIATLIHQSRKIITVQGSIEDEQGAICAHGTGSFRVIS